MKKRLLALILVFALIVSLTGCGKKAKPNEEANTEAEAETEAESEKEESEATDNSDNASEDNEGVKFFSEFKDMEADEPDPEMQKVFAEFVDHQYKVSLESSYMNLHIYYMDPAKAGFNMDNVDIVFGEVPTPENNKEDREYYKGLTETFQTFERKKLTKEQQEEYDCLEWELATINDMLDEKYDYYTQLFAPPNSLEANIISYMSTYELRNEREVQEVVAIINSLPKYVDDAINYAKAQQEKELFMTDFDTVIEGCDDAISIGMDSSVLKNLLNHVDELDEITPENKDKYKKDITEAFEKSYLPSFQAIRDAMESMKGGYNNEEGFATFPHGKEYFETYVNFALGTLGLTAEDIRDYIEKRSTLHTNEAMDIVMTNANDKYVMDFLNQKEFVTTYKDYNDILEEVKTKMLADYPEVKSLEYNVEKADPEEKLTEKNIAAYFLIPPIDGDHKQQMRVDPNTENVSSVDSYTTITHEGFPGHMYQYAYTYEKIASDYIKTLGVTGITEGYAVYSQYNSLKYLDSFSDAFKDIFAINTMLSYLSYASLDVGINNDGWTLEETKEFLASEGYDLDDETAKEIYDFLRCSPGTYEPYGYGYELIAELRENAELALGDKFNALDFNKALLDAGQTPYTVIKRHIAQYVFDNL